MSLLPSEILATVMCIDWWLDEVYAGLQHNCITVQDGLMLADHEIEALVAERMAHDSIKESQAKPFHALEARCHTGALSYGQGNHWLVHCLSMHGILVRCLCRAALLAGLCELR